MLATLSRSCHPCSKRPAARTRCCFLPGETQNLHLHIQHLAERSFSVFPELLLHDSNLPSGCRKADGHFCNRKRALAELASGKPASPQPCTADAAAQLQAPVELQVQQPHGPSTAADNSDHSADGSADSAVCSGGGAASVVQGSHAFKREAAADAALVWPSNRW